MIWFFFFWLAGALCWLAGPPLRIFIWPITGIIILVTVLEVLKARQPRVIEVRHARKLPPGTQMYIDNVEHYTLQAESWLNDDKQASTHRAVYDVIDAPEYEVSGYNPGPGWHYLPYRRQWRRCRWVPL